VSAKNNAKQWMSGNVENFKGSYEDGDDTLQYLSPTELNPKQKSIRFMECIIPQTIALAHSSQTSYYLQFFMSLRNSFIFIFSIFQSI
jgi:hypothetical protein